MSAYSERHKVPSVQEYREIEAERKKASEANNSELVDDANDDGPAPPAKDESTADASKADRASWVGSRQEGEGTEKDDEVSGAGGGAAEKERLKQQMAPKGRPAQSFQARGTRLVTDPVTGGEVQVADDTKNADTDPRKLDSRFAGGYSSNKATTEKGKHDSVNVNPKPAEPGNILLHPLPEPLNADSLERLNGRFRQLAIFLGAAMSVAWFFTAFGAGWFRFFLRTGILGGIGFGAWSGLAVALRSIEKDLEDVRMHMHTQRGKEYSPPIPESVEWLNAAIAVIWKQINPEMFIPMVDQVEDIMQQSLPGVVDAVKISDVGHGTNAFRFVAFRGLADVMSDPNYPREQWITQGKSVEEDVPKDKTVDSAKKPTENDADGDGVPDEDEAGDFLCYEISFSYSAEPGKKSKNDFIHLMLTFFIGNDLVRLPFNVWAQVEKISGTLRVRAQMVQSPPYIRNVTFSLMGVPNIEVSVVPMTKALPNILDLPLISGFVKSSIAAAANEYVAPKSMTMNMAQMLAGDGVKKDTDAVGVLVINIQHGVDLSAQDANGKSDPYVVLSFAKFGRPLYSSRIIFEDLNPNWNETAHILVTKDDLRSDEMLSVQLWDSDKRSADDIVGRVQRKLSELVKGSTLNTFQQFEDNLMGFEDADEMQGQLVWRVGFFEKAKLNRSLMQSSIEEDEKAAKEGNKAQEQAKIEQEAKERKATSVDSAEEADALKCPPDPRWPSGILGMHVHNIVGLERRDVERGVMGKDREGTQGQDVSASGETPEHLPSGYCELLVNDDIIYKTRVKPYTNIPFFEAGTEVFVRDWTKAYVRIAVRDARMREHDPIMGIVNLKLTELFKSSSQVDGMYSIQDGVGFGRVSASFVFKAVKLEHPRSMLGWDTATVELLNNISIDCDDSEMDAKLKKQKITVTTGDDTEKLAAVDRQQSAAGDADEPTARLPVYDRYSSLLSFSIGGGGPFGGAPDAVAVVSLCDLVDDEDINLEIPIFAGKNLGTLLRNHIDEFTEKTHAYKKVGTLRVKVRVDSGLDLDHEKLAVGQTDRHEFEVFNRLEGMPQRAEQNAHADDDGVVDRKEQKSIDKAKREALHARHRGVMGYSAARGSVWAKDNMKDRARKISNKLMAKQERDQTVKSEA